MDKIYLIVDDCNEPVCFVRTLDEAIIIVREKLFELYENGEIFLTDYIEMTREIKANYKNDSFVAACERYAIVEVKKKRGGLE